MSFKKGEYQMKTDVKLRVRNFKRVKIIPASAKDPGPPPIKPIPFPKVWFSLGLVIAVLLVMMGADKMQQSVQVAKYEKEKKYELTLSSRMVLENDLTKLLDAINSNKLDVQNGKRKVCILSSKIYSKLNTEDADESLLKQLEIYVNKQNSDSCNVSLETPDWFSALRSNLDLQIAQDNVLKQTPSRWKGEAHSKTANGNFFKVGLDALVNFIFSAEGIGAYCFKVFLGLLFALLIYGIAIFILCFTQNSYFVGKTVFDVVEEVKKWIGTGLSGAGRALIPLAFVAPVIAGAALATQAGTSDSIRTEASGSRDPKKTSGVEQKVDEQKVDEQKIDVKLRVVDTNGKEIGENGIEFAVRPKVEVQPVPPVVLVGGGGACVAGGQACGTNLAEIGKLTGALEVLATALKSPAPAPAPVPVICQSEHRDNPVGPVPQGYLNLLRRLKELEGKVGAAVKAESMTNSSDSPHKKPNP
jgi:hypothetical protein